VLVLVYVAGLSLDEVARELRLPLGTVKSRLNRARKALAEQFGDAAELGAYSVSHDRRWVYFKSASPTPGICRVPYAGGSIQKVIDTGPRSIPSLAVSPDGSKLAWSVPFIMSPKHPGLKVRDLATRAEWFLPLPGLTSSSRPVDLREWTWSPDSRSLAVAVKHYTSNGESLHDTELQTVNVVTGQWQRRFTFDARHGSRPDCCVWMAWPTGSKRIAVVQFTSSGSRAKQTRTFRLVYVDPATGATTSGVVLASGPALFLTSFDFDASGRYVLFGLEDSPSVSTWWSDGGKPVMVNRIATGGQAPWQVEGVYEGESW